MMKIRFLFIVLFIIPLLSACLKDTEENKVKKIVTNVKEAAEEKKINAVLEHISKSYSDPQGNDYNGIKGILAYNFFRHQKVFIYIPDIDVAVDGLTAQVLFQAVMTERSSGDMLPEALGVYNFEVNLSKEHGTWMITSAKWKHAGDAIVPPQQ